MYQTFDRSITNDDYVKVYYGSVGTADVGWSIWNKPTNCKFVSIFAMPGGGGGGGGGANTAGSNAGGAAGGGSASYKTLLIPAIFLPSILYIRPGNGGLGGAGQVTGGAAGETGGSGTNSYVAVLPDATKTGNLITSFTPPTGGTGGNGATNGTGGSGGTTAVTLSSQINFGLANGASGNIGRVPTSVIAYITNITNAFAMPGGYGGIVSSLGTVANNGGGTTGNGFMPTMVGGSGNASGNGANGFDGINYWGEQGTGQRPMVGMGGSGGGAGIGASAIGGKGGNGAPGSGGGGGGAACGASATGGRGGDGGVGVIVIVCW